jgi:clan AA aspartic protease (TIGR02281 family)
MLVMVKLNNRVTAPFYIDTGASDVLVPQKVADQLGLDTGSDVRTKRYSTANGIIEQKAVMLKSVSLGGATVKNVPASVSDSMSVGLLGLSYFNHFKYKVDTANGVVTLTRNNLSDTGHIRGGRSRAQWASEYRSMHARVEQVVVEYERTPDSHGRERERLLAVQADLERQLEMLESEADSAHVPSSWRR